MVGRLTAAIAPPTPALAGAAVGPDGQAIAGPAGTAALPGGATGEGGTALPGAEGAAEGDEDLVTLAHVQGQMRASSLIRLSKLVEAHPDETLTVLRRWLNPDDS
jgi:flagellar M-ring protein FliF